MKTVSLGEDSVTLEDREGDSVFHHSQEEKGVSSGTDGIRTANHKPSGED